MATKTRARFAEESESSSEPANKNTRALRYDSLASVLTNLDKQVTVLPGKFKLDRISRADPTELAELRANVASLKAENQRLVESLTDQLNQLAERVTELEDQARRPWWRRALDSIGEERAPAARTRKRAVARLRALYLDRATRELRPI
jgi:glucose-6-phosphate-specific signal transduction histidine kinase